MGEEELAMLRSLRVRLASLVFNSAVVMGTALSPALTPVVAQDRDVLAEEGRKLFVQQGCYGCHTIGSTGGQKGPDLSHVGSRYSESALAARLEDPSPTAHMPPIFNTLSDFKVHALAVYLRTLR
jgi:mono/diheme cytochrome c family protein